MINVNHDSANRITTHKYNHTFGIYILFVWPEFVSFSNHHYLNSSRPTAKTPNNKDKSSFYTHLHSLKIRKYQHQQIEDFDSYGSASPCSHSSCRPNILWRKRTSSTSSLQNIDTRLLQVICIGNMLQRGVQMKCTNTMAIQNINCLCGNKSFQNGVNDCSAGACGSVDASGSKAATSYVASLCSGGRLMPGSSRREMFANLISSLEFWRC